MLIENISYLTGIELQKLTYLEKIRNRLYGSFKVRKNNGSYREINPYLCDCKSTKANQELVEYSRLLKTVHRKLKSILHDIPIPENVFGFKPGENIKRCALMHVNKSYVISIDIKNFFPSVLSDYVFEALKKEGWTSAAAWLVARLVARHGRLPQGAITSPVASNIAFKEKDKALIEYCDKNHMVYTRYADDITISTNEELTNEKLSQIMQDIKAIIKPYEINERKLKVYGPNDVHYVLGLVVNKKVNVEKRYRRAIRAAIYNYIHKHVVPKGVDPIKYKRQLLGKTAYCLYINKISSLQKQYDELKAFDPNKVQEWNYVLIDS